MPCISIRRRYLLNNGEVFSSLLSSQFLSWCSTAIAILVAIDTAVRLWTERHRFFKEELGDEDRAFAWRLVLFLLLPFLTFIDLRATDIAAGLAGGYLIKPEYGFIWYNAQLAFDSPVSESARFLVLFAGEAVQIAFALLLLPALLLRPHPFLATFLGYAVAFTLGLNLLVDPALSLAGMGMQRWTELLGAPANPVSRSILFTHLGLTAVYLFCLINSRARLLFSDLSRPQISSELKDCLKEWQMSKRDPNLTLKLGLLYLRAGVKRRAAKMLRALESEFPSTLQTSLLRSLLAFQQRRYKQARLAFCDTANFPDVNKNPHLQASLLAAAACAAFAEGQEETSLSLCERALQIEDACITARMVKVDVFLNQGKKEQAAQEILVAMHLGLDFDLKDKVPLDIEETYASILALQADASSDKVEEEKESREKAAV